MDRNLDEAVRHICFEADQLMQMRMMLIERGSLSWGVYTAWFVHTRNLAKFLCDKGDHDDDIHAKIYAGTGWRNMSGEPENFRKYQDSANILAMHLSWERIGFEGEHYPPSLEITNFVLELWKQFVEAKGNSSSHLFRDEMDQLA